MSRGRQRFLDESGHLDGTFVRLVGFDVDDSVDCNFGHLKDPSFTHFLNSGAVANHAGKTWELSFGYNHDETGVLELWTVRDIKVREEILDEHAVDCELWCWSRPMTTVFTLHHFTPGVLASIRFSRRRRLTLSSTSKGVEVVTDHVLPLLQLREDHHGED